MSNRLGGPVSHFDERSSGGNAMRTIALVLGTLATAATATAMAQTYYRDYRYEPNYVQPPASEPYYVAPSDQRYYYRDERLRERNWARDRSYECWNPRAGHFENVREGEVQNDLDFSRCRIAGSGYIGQYPGYRYR
jgi:hypothetical protein